MDSIRGLTRHDTCPSCGGHYFWGVVQHDDGCETPELYAQPSDLAHRDQLMATMRDFLAEAEGARADTDELKS